MRAGARCDGPHCGASRPTCLVMNYTSPGYDKSSVSSSGRLCFRQCETLFCVPHLAARWQCHLGERSAWISCTMYQIFICYFHCRGSRSVVGCIESLRFCRFVFSSTACLRFESDHHSWKQKKNTRGKKSENKSTRAVTQPYNQPVRESEIEKDGERK